VNPPSPTATARQGLVARLDAELRERDALGLRRQLRVPAGIDLSSNDYLRLSVHPEVTARMAAAVATDGCGSGGSRLLRGHRDVFAEVERAFAAFKGAERSLYFSSGYLANLAVLSTLPKRHDRILSDRLNHASLRDGARLSPAATAAFAHNDRAALRRQLDTPCAGHSFVVTESLFSMDGDAPPLADYAELCRAAGATLIVDEAHAVGLYGERGSGLLEAAGVDANEVISINTAGKALGVAGAFVAGPSPVIEYLVQRARPFVFSTAPPPAVAAALLAALAVIQREPELRCRVLALARRLRTRLAAAGHPVVPGDSPIVPIVLGDSARAMAVADDLQGRGFDVRAIRPPTVPAGTARLRLSVNAGLTESAVDALVEALSCHVASS
jgi:8-amino-7-oxononanoate synthase